jgi:hypothetical protein
MHLRDSGMATREPIDCGQQEPFERPEALAGAGAFGLSSIIPGEKSLI